ncbi:asparaginase [Croceicoccus estronivorus]|uniref:asparaginase n=1 Tax=Croceicoccus estronivorus TaxID=1172626 RepID=UPI000ABC72EC|nr:asparaginase domain-containing protein [Croceicoccus estronivorus]
MHQKIAIIDAGGTISATSGPDGAFRSAGGIGQTLNLLPRTIGERCEIHATGTGLSENLSLADARRIVAMIEAQAAREDVHAVVVAHGTDTMEEVFFMAQLLLRTTKPVIFTGAQRTPEHSGFDGVTNLRDAIVVARHHAAHGAGVLVVFGGWILPAWRCSKIHTRSLAAFGPHSIAVGTVDAAGAHIDRIESACPKIACETPDEEVELLLVGLGTSGRTLERLAQPPVRGVVLQGLGMGNVSEDMLEAARHVLVRGVLLAVAASAEGGAGTAYGSAADLERAGACFAGSLSARKMRILMACVLGGRSGSEASAMLQTLSLA